MMSRNQYMALRKLGNPGCELVSGVRGPYSRQWRACLQHGWVEAAHPEISVENGLRITPAGLRALADALECYGMEL
jgi:hypothetical protein